MIGRKFGDLTVIKGVFPSSKETPRVIRGFTTYLCECKCGNQIKVGASSLHKGKIDCGCKLPEKKFKPSKKRKPIINKDLKEVWDNWRHREAIEQDSSWSDYRTFENDVLGFYEKGSTVFMRLNQEHGYSRTNVRIHRSDIKKKYVWNMTQFCEVSKPETVKRPIIKSKPQNVKREKSEIEGKSPVHGKHGIKGLYWHKRDKKWVARIRRNKVEHFLGTFKEFNDAVHAIEEFLGQE